VENESPAVNLKDAQARETRNRNMKRIIKEIGSLEGTESNHG